MSEKRRGVGGNIFAVQAENAVIFGFFGAERSVFKLLVGIKLWFCRAWPRVEAGGAAAHYFKKTIDSRE
jgi:hypothetical protein